MASPFAFAWMLLKDSARYRPEDRQAAAEERRFQLEQSEHPPMPRPEDEGPTMGEMADMDPEEAEFERELAARRMKPKPNDPAQTTLADFGG